MVRKLLRVGDQLVDMLTQRPAANATLLADERVELLSAQQVASKARELATQGGVYESHRVGVIATVRKNGGRVIADMEIYDLGPNYDVTRSSN